MNISHESCKQKGSLLILVQQPKLSAAIREGHHGAGRTLSDEVYAKAREPKELFVVEGATHMDMYDKPQFVTPAVAKLADFFGKALGS